MKFLVYIFLLFSCFASAQKTASNNPKLTEKLLDEFVLNAELRGLEIRERLSTINRIYFLPGAKNEHWHEGGICTITINSHLSGYEQTFAVYHELGHHLGLNHCLKCTYNIMTEIGNGKRQFFDFAQQQLYIDVYFEALRNPKAYNAGHQHY